MHVNVYFSSIHLSHHDRILIIYCGLCIDLVLFQIELNIIEQLIIEQFKTYYIIVKY